MLYLSIEYLAYWTLHIVIENKYDWPRNIESKLSLNFVLCDWVVFGDFF